MRIIQLTDLHVMSDPAGKIRSVRTRDTFERVLERVEANYADADRMIITGDLTHDELRPTYEWLRERLAAWIGKLRVIPGNHDDRGLMREVFGDRLLSAPSDRNVFIDEFGDWRLIGLDSHVPGQLAGELGAKQLHWLADKLKSPTDQPTCLFLHHPPVMVNSAWLDRIGLSDGAELLDLVRAFPQIRAVCCGHIHQERTMTIGHTTIFSSPSCGVQFRPETESLEVDPIAPGFRVIDLLDDGELQTRVERVAGD